MPMRNGTRQQKYYTPHQSSCVVFKRHCPTQKIGNAVPAILRKRSREKIEFLVIQFKFKIALFRHSEGDLNLSDAHLEIGLVPSENRNFLHLQKFWNLRKLGEYKSVIPGKHERRNPIDQSWQTLGLVITCQDSLFHSEGSNPILSSARLRRPGLRNRQEHH